MDSSQPQTPTWPCINSTCTWATPQRWKTQIPGIKPPKKSISELEELKEKLKLSFTPDEWQAYLIQWVLEGYDSIFCAGTGYVKSLIFKGIAALGGQGKVVTVISPLKALQKDQVNILLEFDNL